VRPDLESCLASSAECTQKLTMLTVLLTRYSQAVDLEGDMVTLKREIEELQEKCSEMSLCDVQQRLQARWVPEIERSLTILHQLCSNELFLHLWNQTAVSLTKQDNDEPAPAPADQDPADNEPNEINWDWRAQDNEVDRSEREGEVQSIGVAPIDKPEPVIVKRLSFSSLKEMNCTLIEEVLSKCMAIGLSIFEGKIPVAQLQGLLNYSSNITQLMNDLARILTILQDSRDSASPEGPNISFDTLQRRLEPLQQGLLMYQFADSFVGFLERLGWGIKDMYKLKDWNQSMATCLASGNLTELADHVRTGPVCGVLKKLSLDEALIAVLADFFRAVSQGEEFILQLRTVEKSELRAILDLCKSNTDKDSELQALANFRDASNIVYALEGTTDTQKGIDWDKFANAINDLNISQATVRQITDINAQMLELKRVFADAYKGSSTRAIADLYNLFDNGFFCLVSPSKTEMMHANLVSPQCLFATTFGGVSSNQTTDQQEIKRSFDWLEELRNRLMLATDMGSQDLQAIETFLDMLVLFKEINERRVELFISGHPRFQAYEKRVRVQDCVCEQLEREKIELKRCLDQWNALLYKLRLKYYYLNFFTIHELLAIVSLVEELQHDGEMPGQLLAYLKFVKLDLDERDTYKALVKIFKDRVYWLLFPSLHYRSSTNG